MEPITKKTISVVSGSGIALMVLALLLSLGVLYVYFTAIAENVWKQWFNLTITGIAFYYLAFSVLSWLYITKYKKK